MPVNAMSRPGFWFCVLLSVCGLTATRAQTAAPTFYDRYDEKTYSMDAFSTQELLYRAAESGDSLANAMYNYLMSKNGFSVHPSDTVNLAGYGTYMRLAHFRVLKHRYAEADTFLQLARMAKQPEHFCGNAYQAWAEERETHEWLCALVLTPAAKEKHLKGLVDLAIESSYESGYSGAGLLHYLKYWYGNAGMKKILANVKYTIKAQKVKTTYDVYIEATGKLLTAPFTFNVYDMDGYEQSDDPAVHKQLAVKHWSRILEKWLGKEF